jgi:hypothetical protein
MFNALVVAFAATVMLVKWAVTVVLVNICRRITSGLIIARGVICAPGFPGDGETCGDVVGKVTRVAGVVGEPVVMVRCLVVVGMRGVDVSVGIRGVDVRV